MALRNSAAAVAAALAFTALPALAGEVGPDAITTHAIAARMGVTQGAVFRHFPDKASIWLAVFAFVRAGLDEALTRALANARTPLGRLEAAFVAHVGFIAANPGVPRVLYHELQLPDDSPVRSEVRRMILDYRVRLERLFSAARAAGDLPRGLDPALAAILFIGAVQGLVIEAALEGRDAAIVKRARPMFQLLVNGFGATRGRRRA